MTDGTSKRKRAATVTRRYGGMDASERLRERQRKLIDAGLEVFGQRGYHLSTVKDVCAAAGLTERYFYESFKTMGALFDAVFNSLRDQLQQRIMAAVLAQGMTTTKPMELGESTLRAWYLFLHEDPRRARIMLVDAVSVSDSGMRGAEASINEFGGILKGFVTLMYPDMASTGYDLNVLVSALTGATIYVAKDWIRSGFKMTVDEVLKHNMALFRSMDALYRATTAATNDQATAPAPGASSRSRRRTKA